MAARRPASAVGAAGGVPTGRDGWWRSYLRATPPPGTYRARAGLVEAALGRPCSAAFRARPRVVAASAAGTGALLLPGAYDPYDPWTELVRRPATYRFRGPRRPDASAARKGERDKDLHTGEH